MNAARSILFIRTDRVGETVLNLPAVAALDAAWPDASITMLVHPALEPLVSRAVGVDRVLEAPADPAPWWTQAGQLHRLVRPHRFDVAIVSNPTKAAHVAVWCAGIPQRVGYARKWGRWLLTHRLEDRKALGDRHEVEYNLDLVRALGVPPAISPNLFPPLARELDDVRRVLAGQGLGPSQPFIAVHPWTSNAAKQWPLERFSALIERIAGPLGMPVVVIGQPEGGSPTHQTFWGGGRSVIDLIGRLSLPQLAALLQGARLLVSNDSGPVHVAAAVGTRTVVLFGASHPGAGSRRWGPWGAGHIVLDAPSMEAISVEDAFAAVQRAVRDGPTT
ncbi:MAG: glycosyltransferase family 9 protein [Candidatus Omnitrophica bacterium]|nr:glycosyltransferase family 9 protein [Candidatus Omnitrophota bacterium]